MKTKFNFSDFLRGNIRNICKLYPLYSGRGTIANTSLFRAISRTSEPIVMTKLYDGSMIFVNLDDYVGRPIYYFGDLDRKISWVFQKVLRPGDTVLDIGANFGLYTMYASKLVGQRGHVHAFEPQQNLAELIKKSAQINGYSQITLHNIALSEDDGIIDLFIPTDNSGRASLSKKIGRSGTIIQVQKKNTANYLSSLAIDTIRLMKLDVEGHEEIILQSGLEFFRTHRPDVILFEEHKKPIAQQPTVKLIESIGYVIFEIPKSKFRMRLLEINHETNSRIPSHDFVAVKQDYQGKDIATALRLKSVKLRN